jgi:transcription antitermination factor NusG
MGFIKSDGQRRWYAVQTASGHENKVKEHIEKRIVTMGAQDKIFGVIVPSRRRSASTPATSSWR